MFGGREIDNLLANYFTGVLREEGLPEERAKGIPAGQIGQIKAWKEHVLSGTLNRGEVCRSCSFLQNILDMFGASLVSFSLGRPAFEKLLEDYLGQFPALVRGCLEEAGRKLPSFCAEDIELVILTGGHSQWYFVREMLTCAMTQYGAVDLPAIAANPGRLLNMPRPQEIVSLGLVYQPLVARQNAIPKKSQDLTDLNRQGIATWFQGQIYFVGQKGRVFKMPEEGGAIQPVTPEGEKYRFVYASKNWILGVNMNTIEDLEKNIPIVCNNNGAIHLLRVADEATLFYAGNGKLREGLVNVLYGFQLGTREGPVRIHNCEYGEEGPLLDSAFYFQRTYITKFPEYFIAKYSEGGFRCEQELGKEHYYVEWSLHKKKLDIAEIPGFNEKFKINTYDPSSGIQIGNWVYFRHWPNGERDKATCARIRLDGTGDTILG